MKKTRKSNFFVKLLLFMTIIVVIWFIFTIYEFTRVKKDQKPLLCYKEVSDIENENEYSKTCYGVLYKYREYYYNDTDEISAREFTLFFKDFQRKVSEDETK